MVNFVDQLAQKIRLIILKEMVPDETILKAVRSWYQNSWIREVLSELQGYNVVVTSDHGSIMVNESSIVKADEILHQVYAINME